MAPRILVIEDNAANMELMIYLLRAFGYEPLMARDGAEGLEVAAREHPDAIICDVQMPVMNGFEVAQRIKIDPALRNIPLIAVTAFAMVDDRQKMLAAGFDGYLPKPISPETFVQQVQAFLPVEKRARTASAGSTANGTAPPPRQRGRKLLVVDDRDVNLDLAASVFAGSGYGLVTARTMAEALRLAREAPPDLIMSDVCMADGSGFDFIKVVKADPALRSIPFVFVTSTMTSETDRRTGLALGAARYIFRPIEPPDLLREIEACIDKAREG